MLNNYNKSIFGLFGGDSKIKYLPLFMGLSGYAKIGSYG